MEIAVSVKEMNILLFEHNKKLNNQNMFFRKLNNVTPLVGISSKKFWQRLDEISKRDSLSYKWDNSEEVRIVFKDIGFQNKQDLEVFIANNRMTEKEILEAAKAADKRANIIKIRQDIIDTSKSKFSFKEKVSCMSYTVILSIICVFCLRYLFYGLKWSIQVLNQKE